MSDEFMDLLGPEVQRLRDPAPNRFAAAAVGTDEFQLSEKQTLILSAENPGHKVALNPLTVQRITANKIRVNFMQMLQREDENITAALTEIRTKNPQIYLQLLIELAQFITPKLRATKVVIDDETRRNDANALRDASIEQLQGMLNGSDD